ncbi:MAG: glucosaminidase domain-containing protein [Saprospiraceae bacterium]|nr:glucosaminidase domain-containing protein [Saprospiraceae bacterium]
MKNRNQWLLTALIALCFLTNVFAQKLATNPDHIFVDTLGNYVHYQPTKIVNKGGKIEKGIIDKVIDAALDGWDAIFDQDRPKVVYDAFNIGVETTYNNMNTPSPKESFQTVNLSLANRDIPKVDEPVPVFEKKEMTVKFENGKFVPILPKKDTVVTGKGIVEQVFKIDVVDEDEQEDLDFFKSNTFVFNKEVYHRVSKEEMETEEYKKPRIKKVKPQYEEKVERIDLGERVAEKKVKTIKKVNIASNEEFIDLYEDAAMDGERYGVPYSITMAQGILESRGGRSRLAMALNNLFGIKCSGGRCKKEGCPHGYFDDDREQETFEKHASYEASFKRHIKFFLDNDRYDKCLACGTMDIPCWLYRLQKSGYASDKMYDYKLAEIINRYKLTPKPIRYNRKEVVERLKTVK